MIFFTILGSLVYYNSTTVFIVNLFLLVAWQQLHNGNTNQHRKCASDCQFLREQFNCGAVVIKVFHLAFSNLILSFFPY